MGPRRPLANGNGICLVSSVILGINPGYDIATIRSVYRDYLGCTDLIIVPPTEASTGHVNMWMLWLDHKTLVVGEFTADQHSAARATIEAMIVDQLTGLTDPKTGEAIEIVRIPMADPMNQIGTGWRTYTNGTWINDTFLMPTYAGFETTEAEVTAILEARGVNVVPINSDIIVGQAGAIHCISKTIPSPTGLPDFINNRDAGVSQVDSGVGSDDGGGGCCGVHGGSSDTALLVVICALVVLRPARGRRGMIR